MSTSNSVHKMSVSAKSRLKSTWTPLSNEEQNNKLFEERRTIINKWFEKWNTTQRKKVLEELLGQCKRKQLEFVAEIASKKTPTYHLDFTRTLPRVIVLYIFSFLDPRSLCRCAKVCWYWKFLTELDQLWMPKCLKLGWYLTFSPSPFESGVWKRHYIESLLNMRYMPPREFPKLPTEEVEKMRLDSPPESERTMSDCSTALPSSASKKPPRPSHTPMEKTRNTPKKSSSGTPASKKPAWRGADPVPKDIMRYNYLNNEDEVEKVNKLRKKSKYGKESEEISKAAKSKINTGKNVLNTKPRRSSSLSRLNEAESVEEVPLERQFVQQHDQRDFTWNSYHRINYLLPHPGTRLDGSLAPSEHGSLQQNTRPAWAQNSGHGNYDPQALLQGTKRPGPVQSIVKTATRTERDMPSSPLFPHQPWQLPDDAQDYDSDDNAYTDKVLKNMK